MLSIRSHSPSCYSQALLVHADTESAEVLLRQVDLGHQLLVSLWDVVESQDAEAEAEEEESAEGDEGPEGELGSC